MVMASFSSTQGVAALMRLAASFSQWTVAAVVRFVLSDLEKKLRTPLSSTSLVCLLF